jgi:hypothetical protein
MMDANWRSRCRRRCRWIRTRIHGSHACRRFRYLCE